MKFNVGDKVRVNRRSTQHNLRGKVGTILDIQSYYRGCRDKFLIVVVFEREAYIFQQRYTANFSPNSLDLIEGNPVETIPINCISYNDEKQIILNQNN